MNSKKLVENPFFTIKSPEEYNQLAIALSYARNRLNDKVKSEKLERYKQIKGTITEQLIKREALRQLAEFDNFLDKKVLNELLQNNEAVVQNQVQANVAEIAPINGIPVAPIEAPVAPAPVAPPVPPPVELPDPPAAAPVEEEPVAAAAAEEPLAAAARRVEEEEGEPTPFVKSFNARVERGAVLPDVSTFSQDRLKSTLKKIRSFFDMKGLTQASLDYIRQLELNLMAAIEEPVPGDKPKKPKKPKRPKKPPTDPPPTTPKPPAGPPPATRRPRTGRPKTGSGLKKTNKINLMIGSAVAGNNNKAMLRKIN